MVVGSFSSITVETKEPPSGGSFFLLKIRINLQEEKSEFQIIASALIITLILVARPGVEPGTFGL